MKGNHLVLYGSTQVSRKSWNQGCSSLENCCRDQMHHRTLVGKIVHLGILDAKRRYVHGKSFTDLIHSSHPDFPILDAMTFFKDEHAQDRFS